MALIEIKQDGDTWIIFVNGHKRFVGSAHSALEHLAFLIEEKRVGHKIELENKLSNLAELFRVAIDESWQQEIVREYERSMQALFATGEWCGEPDAEDQLPVEFMPNVYKRFWADKLRKI